MTEAEFDIFRRHVVRSYAEDNVAAGRWTAEEAEAAAGREMDQILSAGFRTPDQFFFTVHADAPARRVGVLWVAIRPGPSGPAGYVYDVEIDAPERRRGFGEATMRAAEEVVRAKGATRIWLNVFGANAGARALYERLGYRAMAIAMGKR